MALAAGLVPSKTKAVAKTRLLDTLRAGTLAVPKETQKIETDFHKTWRMREKAARDASNNKKRTESEVAPAANKRANPADSRGGEEEEEEEEDGGGSSSIRNGHFNTANQANRASKWGICWKWWWWKIWCVQDRGRG